MKYRNYKVLGKQFVNETDKPNIVNINFKLNGLTFDAAVDINWEMHAYDEEQYEEENWSKTTAIELYCFDNPDWDIKMVYQTLNNRKNSMEIQHLGYTFECNCIHGGQYHPYGDTFKEYSIETTCQDRDIVVDMIKTILRPEDKDIPVKEEWRKLEGPDNYFRGYYELKVEPYGYRYIKCEPYTD